jgi:hypothetical protein
VVHKALHEQNAIINREVQKQMVSFLDPLQRLGSNQVRCVMGLVTGHLSPIKMDPANSLTCEKCCNNNILSYKSFFANVLRTAK